MKDMCVQYDWTLERDTRKEWHRVADKKDSKWLLPT